MGHPVRAEHLESMLRKQYGEPQPPPVMPSLKTHPLIEQSILAIRQLMGQVKHWKSNHAAAVARARVLIERPDMPLERVRAYKEMERMQLQLSQPCVGYMDCHGRLYSRRMVVELEMNIEEMTPVIPASGHGTPAHMTVSKTQFGDVLVTNIAGASDLPPGLYEASLRQVRGVVLTQSRGMREYEDAVGADVL